MRKCASFAQANRYPFWNIEDSIYVTLSFKSGVVGTWAWSVAAPGRVHCQCGLLWQRRLTARHHQQPFSHFPPVCRPTTATTVTLCAKMAGVIPWLKSSSLYRDPPPRSSRAALPGNAGDGFAIEIWEFVELIQVSARPEVDAAEGLKSLALGEAIYESAFTGEVIRLDEILSGQRDHYQAPINAHWKL